MQIHVSRGQWSHGSLRSFKSKTTCRSPGPMGSSWGFSCACSLLLSSHFDSLSSPSLSSLGSPSPPMWGWSHKWLLHYHHCHHHPEEHGVLQCHGNHLSLIVPSQALFSTKGWRNVLRDLMDIKFYSSVGAVTANMLKSVSLFPPLLIYL